MDYSLPGSSVHGISQAKILEWAAIFFSRGSSQPKDQTPISCIGRQILHQKTTWAQPVYIIFHLIRLAYKSFILVSLYVFIFLYSEIEKCCFLLKYLCRVMLYFKIKRLSRMGNGFDTDFK